MLQSPPSSTSHSRRSELDIQLWPRQLDLIYSSASEKLFGGASEGGKSHGVRAFLCVLCGLAPLQCFIFRKYYNDVITNHMQGETGFPVLLRNWQKDGLVKITENQVRFLETGALISLAQMREDSDLEKHQGIPKHIMVLDEATQMKERHIKGLRGWVRMSEEMKTTLPKLLAPLYPNVPPEVVMEMFPQIIYTANPIGESVSFFRRVFVKARPPMAIEKVGAFRQQYIPSRIDDNPSANKEAQRERLLSMGDEAVADALITGNWDAPIGDFLREYNDDLHVLNQERDVTPPIHWYKYRCYDWGTAEPSVCYWVAVSDGEVFEDAGESYWLPRGAKFYYREWNMANPAKPAEGLRLTNEQMAKGIVARTPEVTSGYTVTDSFPFQDRGGWTIAHEFHKHGCPLIQGDTSRVPGWSQLRSHLKGREIENGVWHPMLYFNQSCKAARDYLPALERHPTKAEDAVEHGETTHSCDAIRLGCMVFPIVKDAPRTVVAQDFTHRTLTMTPENIVKRLKKNARRSRAA